MRQRLLAFFHNLRQGYLIWPLGLALGGVAIAFVVRQVDSSGAIETLNDMEVSALTLSPSAAQDVLSTVATAAVTILSLVYSMTLVVFTLAASALGNRIIRTFGDNVLGQITAGILAATFLFSLTALYLANDDKAPLVSTALAVLLALASVLLLIAFVNDVAHRIQIDNELARVQRILVGNVEALVRGARRSANPQRVPDRKDLPVTHEVKSLATGYIVAVHGPPLVRTMQSTNGWLMMRTSPGDFVLQGETVATAFLGDAPSDANKFGRELAENIEVADAHAPGNDILFNVHLMVEIALRALSPGVNDSYTAVAAIDQLSAALAKLLDSDDLTMRLTSEDGTVRVITQPIAIKAVLGAALHPVRRAAASNVLVMLALARALGRLGTHASAGHGALLRNHIRLATSSGRQAIGETEDRDELSEALWAAWRKTKRLPQ